MVSSSSPSSTGAWPSVRTAARGIIGTWSSSVQLRMCHRARRLRRRRGVGDGKNGRRRKFLSGGGRGERVRAGGESHGTSLGLHLLGRRRVLEVSPHLGLQTPQSSVAIHDPRTTPRVCAQFSQLSIKGSPGGAPRRVSRADVHYIFSRLNRNESHPCSTYTLQ